MKNVKFWIKEFENHVTNECFRRAVEEQYKYISVLQVGMHGVMKYKNLVKK